MTKDQAEKQIAEILKQVEQSYGCLVTKVSIKRREVSGVDDDNARHVESVHISFYLFCEF